MDIIKSYNFGEDLGEKVAVKFSTEGTVVKATAPTDEICGVTVFAGENGARGDVLLLGLGKVATSGAVNVGEYLVATTGGKFKALDTTELDTGDVISVVGQALESASADAYLSALIKPQMIMVAKTTTDTQEESNGGQE